jgi:hypothetical protein
MRLNTARQCWFDAHYTPRDSQGSFIERLGLMGTMVQMTDRDSSTPAAMHQALAGRIQGAIKTLPRHVQSFGHHMYSPIHDDDDDLREAVEAYVFMIAYQAFTKETRMTAKKAEKARYVAAGVLYRYRRMHQGGASACADPLEKPEFFRLWLLQEKGIKLSSEQWAREWQPFIDCCFAVCNDADKQALSAVGRCLGEMREAA